VIGVGFQVSFLFYDTVHLYVVMALIECEHRRRSSILLDPHALQLHMIRISTLVFLQILPRKETDRFFLVSSRAGHRRSTAGMAG
jgi:hypothetical protein